jgi:hypothetical protein
MEYPNKQYMVMDSKIYKPPNCQKSSMQEEQEEIAEAFTMVIVTDKHHIEIEIG